MNYGNEISQYKTLHVWDHTLEYVKTEQIPVHIVPLAHLCDPVGNDSVVVYIHDMYALAYWVSFGHPVVAAGPYADLIRFAADNGLSVVDAAYRPR